MSGFSKVPTPNPSQLRRDASPHLPLTLDDDASPHKGMYLTVVGLLPRALEGVCIALSFTQSSGVKRSFVVRRCGVRMGVLVDPSDPRPTLDGDVGRLEAEVFYQDRLGWMFLYLGRWMFVGPGDGHNEKSAPHNQRCHSNQQDDAPHKRNLLLLMPHHGAFVHLPSRVDVLRAWGLGLQRRKTDTYASYLPLFNCA